MDPANPLRIVPKKQWETGSKKCAKCSSDFGLLKRPKNCNRCGRQFCSSCLEAEASLSIVAGSPMEKVCLDCFIDLQAAKRQQSSSTDNSQILSKTSSFTQRPVENQLSADVNPSHLRSVTPPVSVAAAQRFSNTPTVTNTPIPTNASMVTSPQQSGTNQLQKHVQDLMSRIDDLEKDNASLVNKHKAVSEASKLLEEQIKALEKRNGERKKQELNSLFEQQTAKVAQQQEEIASLQRQINDMLQREEEKSKKASLNGADQIIKAKQAELEGAWERNRAELANREEAINARELDLAARATASEAEFDHMMKAKQAEFETRWEQLEEQRVQLEEEEKNIQRREMAIAEREGTASQEETDQILKVMQEEIVAAQKQLEAERAQLDEDKEYLCNREKENAARAAALQEEFEQTVAAKEEEFEALEKQLETMKNLLEAESAKLTKEKEFFSKCKKEVVTRRDTASQSEIDEILSAKIDSAHKQLDLERTQLEEGKKNAQNHENEIATRAAALQKKFEQTIKAKQSEFQNIKKQLEDERVQLNKEKEEVLKHEEKITASQLEADNILSAKQVEFVAEQKKLNDAQEQLAVEFAQLTQEKEAMKAECARLVQEKEVAKNSAEEVATRVAALEELQKMIYAKQAELKASKNKLEIEHNQIEEDKENILKRENELAACLASSKADFEQMVMTREAELDNLEKKLEDERAKVAEAGEALCAREKEIADHAQAAEEEFVLMVKKKEEEFKSLEKQLETEYAEKTEALHVLEKKNTETTTAALLELEEIMKIKNTEIETVRKQLEIQRAKVVDEAEALKAREKECADQLAMSQAEFEHILKTRQSEYDEAMNQLEAERTHLAGKMEELKDHEKKVGVRVTSLLADEDCHRIKKAELEDLAERLDEERVNLYKERNAAEMREKEVTARTVISQEAFNELMKVKQFEVDAAKEHIRREVVELKEEREALDAREIELTDRTEALESQENTLQARFEEQMKQKHEELDTAQKALNENIAEFDSAKTAFEREKIRTQESFHARELEIASRATASQVEADKMIKIKQAELEANHQSLEKEIAKLVKDKEALDAREKKISAKADSLQVEVDNLVKGKMSELEKAQTQVESERKKLKEKTLGVDARDKEVRERSIALHNEFEQLKAKRAEIAAADDQLNIERAKLVKNKEAIAAQEQEIINRITSAHIEEQKIKVMKAEIEAERQQLDLERGLLKREKEIVSAQEKENVARATALEANIDQKIKNERAELESELEQLKTLQNEQAKQTETFDHREKQIASQEENLRREIELIAIKQSEIDAKNRLLETEREVLASEREAIGIHERVINERAIASQAEFDKILQTKQTELEAACEKLVADRVKLDEEIEAANVREKKITTRATASQSEIDEMLKVKQTELVAVREQLAADHTRLNEEVNAFNIRKNELADMDSSLQERVIRITEKEAELDAARKIIEEERSRLVNENEAVEVREQTMVAQATKLQESVQELNIKCAELQIAQDQLAADREQLAREKEATDTRETNLSSRISSLKTEAREIKARKAEMENAQERLEQDRALLAQAKEASNTREVEISSRIAAMLVEDNKLKAQKEALTVAESRLEGNIKELEMKKLEFQEERNQTQVLLSAREAELRSKEQQLMEQLTVMTNERIRFIEEKCKVESEIKEAEARKTQIQRKAAETEEEINKKLVEAEKKINANRAESAVLVKEISDLRAKLIAEIETERAVLIRDENAAKSKIADAEQRFLASEKAWKEVNAARSLLENDQIQFNASVVALKQDREEFTQKYELKQAELDAAAQKLNKEINRFETNALARENALRAQAADLAFGEEKLRKNTQLMKEEIERQDEQHRKAAEVWLAQENERLNQRERVLQEREFSFERCFIMTMDDVNAVKDNDTVMMSESTPKGRWSKKSIIPPLSNMFSPSNQPRISVETLPYFVDLKSWAIDTFTVAAQIPTVLQSFVFTAAEQWGLIGTVVDANQLKRFCATVEACYVANPYHNAIHAADVMQSAVALVSHCPSLFANMTDIDKLGFLIGAACHDIQHPGRSNSFMNAISDPIAVRYGSTALLEHHHIAVTFDIMRNTNCDISTLLNDVDATVLRKLISTLILGTDIEQHDRMLSHWQEVSQKRREDICKAHGEQHSLPPFYSDKAVRHECLSLLLHAADISSCSKPVPIAKKWAVGILKEMKAESDEVQERGLQDVQMMDSDIPNGQIHFIDTFVVPLFYLLLETIIEEPMVTVLPQVQTSTNVRGRPVCDLSLQDPLRCLTEVRSLWAKQAGVPTPLPPRQPLSPTAKERIAQLEGQLNENNIQTAKRRQEIDNIEAQLQRRLQEVEKMEEKATSVAEQQVQLEITKNRVASVVQEMEKREVQLKEAMRKYSEERISEMHKDRRKKIINDTFLLSDRHRADGGTDDGSVPTDEELELRRQREILEERERKVREKEAEQENKERWMSTKERDIQIADKEIQRLLTATKADNSSVKEILEREAMVRAREVELEQAMANYGHYHARLNAASEIEDRLAVRAFENEMRTSTAAQYVTEAANLKSEVERKYNNIAVVLSRDEEVGKTIKDMKQRQLRYIHGNYARFQERLQAGKASKNPRPPSPGRPEMEKWEEQCNNMRNGDDGAAAVPDGFIIEDSLQRLEHKVFSLTNCLGMFARI